MPNFVGISNTPFDFDFASISARSAFAHRNAPQNFEIDEEYRAPVHNTHTHSATAIAIFGAVFTHSQHVRARTAFRLRFAQMTQI